MDINLRHDHVQSVSRLFVSYLFYTVSFVPNNKYIIKLTETSLIYAHGYGIYICSRLFRIFAHAELFDIFHLFTLLLEEFDYTVRIQYALIAVERK